MTGDANSLGLLAPSISSLESPYDPTSNFPAQWARAYWFVSPLNAPAVLSVPRADADLQLLGPLKSRHRSAHQPGVGGAEPGRLVVAVAGQRGVVVQRLQRVVPPPERLGPAGAARPALFDQDDPVGRGVQVLPVHVDVGRVLALSVVCARLFPGGAVESPAIVRLRCQWGLGERLLGSAPREIRA